MKKMKLYKTAVFVLAVTVVILTGDGRISRIPAIRIGYASGGGSVLLEEIIHNGFHTSEEMILKMYVYDNEDDLLGALCDNTVDVALLENENKLFDNKISTLRMIMKFQIDCHADLAVCVREDMLEENLELLFAFAKVIDAGTEDKGAIMLVKPDEWVELYRKMGYEDNQIMQYIVPDFQFEALEQ